MNITETSVPLEERMELHAEKIAECGWHFTEKSDVLLSLDAKWISKITSQEKNYEFRKYKINPEAKRMWIYVNKPTSRLSYVAFFKPAIVFPEKIRENGVGNADFNNGLKVSKFAYRLTKLYELERKLSASDLKQLDLSPPQGFVYLSKKTKALDFIKQLRLKKIF